MQKLILLFTALVLFQQKAFLQNALPNAGFEEWTTTGSYENPDGWNTGNSYSTLIGVTLTTKACAPDVHSGSHALKTETIYIGAPVNQPVPGLVTTGNLQITTQTIDGGTPYFNRPDSIAGWYKFTPGVDDSSYIAFILFSFFRDTIATAIFSGGNTNGVYQRFSAPLVYRLPDNPYTAITLITPGPRYNPDAGSMLWLDDLELVFATALEEQVFQEQLSVFPNPANDILYFNNPANAKIDLFIFDVQGRKVFQSFYENNRAEIPLYFSDGFYTVRFQKNNEFVKQEKLIINH